MTIILSVRKAIKRFFDSYDLYLMPCLKFLLAFFTFLFINRTFSFSELLGKGFIPVVLALFCAILPVAAITFIGFFLIVFQCFAADIVIGAAALVFFVLLIILLLRFVPSHLLWVILTPFAFSFNIAAVIPVSLGILKNRSSVVAGLAGVAVTCFLADLPNIATSLSLERMTRLEAVQELIRSFIGQEELILSAIVFTAVILIVNVIRRLLTKYTYLVAVLVGCAFYIILRLFGRVYLDISSELPKEILGVVLSCVLCLIISFFIHCADYKRTQILQFEDDEYYYYVKAVPKRTPDTPDEYDEEEDDESEEADSDDESDSNRGFRPMGR